MKLSIGLLILTLFTSNIIPQNVEWEFLGLEDAIIFDIAIDDSSNIYVIGENDLVNKSSDNGLTWVPKVNGITSSTATSLDIDSYGSLYLAALGGVFKSTNGGDLWTRVDSNIPDLEFLTLKIIPNDIIFVSNFDGIYRSTDLGSTWVLTDYTIFGAEDMGINTNGVMIVGNISASWFSIYRSTNLGVNWTFVNNFAVASLLFSDNGYIFAGNSGTPFFEQDLYKSTDDGLSWHRTFSFLSGNLLSFPDMELDSNGDFYVMAYGTGFNTGIYMSPDTASTWLYYGSPGGSLVSLAIDSSGYVYAGTNQNGIFRMAGRTVPVELISFEGEFTGKNVLLNWSTATEINNMGFEVERKIDNDEWEKIGFVPGFGTATENKSYEYVDNSVGLGTYFYRLKQIDYDGSFKYSEPIEIDINFLNKFNLEQNYPNPFNPTTKIKYSIPQTDYVTLKIYDVLGNEITTLVNEEKPSGNYEVEFNGEGLSSGIYIYRLSSGNYSDSKKLLLLK